MQYWWSSGRLKNWEVAISSKVWGVDEDLKSLWDSVSIGDLLIFYVIKPVSGVIGIGHIVDKFVSEEPLFPDEKEGVIWRYRLRFEIIYVLPRDLWKRERIHVDLPSTFYRAGLNPVDEGHFLQLLKEMISRWKDFPVEKVRQLISAPIKIGYERYEKKESERKHDEIVREIKEIGAMEGFSSEDEYRVDGLRLDVVWRPNIPEGVPKYVFEVELSGNFPDALVRLMYAYEKWANPKLYLVVKEEDREKVEKLLSGPFYKLKDKVIIVTLEEIDELYNLEQKIYELKKKLGII